MVRLSIAVVAAVSSVALTAIASAADMPAKAPPASPAVAPYNWTGFYVGGNAGWSWSKQDHTGIQNDSLVFADSTHPNDFMGGVQGGYNWQVTPNWILGIEADFQGSVQNASGNPVQANNSFSFFGIGPPFVPPFGFSTGFFFNNFAETATHNSSLLWTNTVRGRIGYAIRPDIMLYGTGGLAYGRLKESVSIAATNSQTFTAFFPFFVPNQPIFSTSASQSFTKSATSKIGWTAGAGIEGYVPNTRMTWKIEYLHMDLGTLHYSFSDETFGLVEVSTHLTNNLVRVGLNYQFH